MKARACKEVVERGMAAKKLEVVFPNAQPPPMTTQLQNLGGVSDIAVGAFCEHNDQAHSLVNPLATKAGPGAETETGLDNKSAVAFEKRRIRLRVVVGAWRNYHGHIHARLPSSTPAPPLPKRTSGALTNAKSARRATSPSPSPAGQLLFYLGFPRRGASTSPSACSGLVWLVT
jgi:hypothetical protein